ncbi:MAG: asparagine synthase (glutamine-hydrolyzing) [Deltaproteobacteria bacterium]|nr:asparagine synthase (glutamine-hydrolyzing) [Deltaproteobacteria bacterium]
MCGIAGIWGPAGPAEAEAALARLLPALALRGPDGRGVHLHAQGAFGHTRLAIVDVAHGAQPLYNEDGRVGVVYNGEIYNYRELRQELQAQGHQFRTNSDTEVIVHLFEQEGEAAFARLTGMFALALWTDDAAYLVRDPVGVKPLYYYQDATRLIFASQLSALLALGRGPAALPDLDFGLDPGGLAQYLAFRYCPAGETVYGRIKKLPPGHFLKIGPGAGPVRYADILGQAADIPPGEELAALEATLSEVVASQLMGEAPLGLTLSGGLDSSTLAWFLARAGARPETFNIGFPGVNEFAYSSEVARQAGLNHTLVRLDASEVPGLLPAYIQAIDEPLADAACLPLYCLGQAMREKVTVVFSGEGGDEVFGGYPQYARTLAAHHEAGPAAFRFFLDHSQYFLDRDGWLVEPPAPGPARAAAFRGSLLSAMTDYDLATWVPENLMMKADKILMAHSLEGRFPLLDPRVIAVARGLADRDKIGPDGEGKLILKRLMAGRLPAGVLTRPKMGFSVPLDELLAANRDLCLDLLATASPLDAVLRREELRARALAFYAGEVVSPLLVWTVFVLYYWMRQNHPTAGAR